MMLLVSDHAWHRFLQRAPIDTHSLFTELIHARFATFKQAIRQMSVESYKGTSSVLLTPNFQIPVSDYGERDDGIHVYCTITMYRRNRRKRHRPRAYRYIDPGEMPFSRLFELILPTSSAMLNMSQISQPQPMQQEINDVRRKLATTP